MNTKTQTQRKQGEERSITTITTTSRRRTTWKKEQQKKGKEHKQQRTKTRIRTNGKTTRNQRIINNHTLQR